MNINFFMKKSQFLSDIFAKNSCNYEQNCLNYLERRKTMNTIIEEKLSRLAELAETAQNKKILIEEMRLVSAKAFELQDELMSLLDAQELVEKEFDAIQELFDIREAVWDIVNKIALRELDVKEKSLSKETYQSMKAEAKEHHCCGEHAHDGECCGEHAHDGECCGGHAHDGECCGGHAHDGECCGGHAHDGECCGKKKKGGCCRKKTEIN